jgi:hypothetical protein
VLINLSAHLLAKHGHSDCSRMMNNDGKHNVAIACLPMGMVGNNKAGHFRDAASDTACQLSGHRESGNCHEEYGSDPRII